MKIFKIFVSTIVMIGCYGTAKGQSQVGNPTNAYWDGVNLPMAQVETGVYAIYSGDTDQDGTVDALDINFIDNDASSFAFGYNVSDLTGDGATDASDLNIVDNNSQLFLFTAQP
jgi:hypothetical protein